MHNTFTSATLAALLALALAPTPAAFAAESGERAQQTKAKLDATRAAGDMPVTQDSAYRGRGSGGFDDSWFSLITANLTWRS